MKMNAIINRVTVEARAAGVDQTTAAVKRLDDAVDGLTVANDRTTKSTLSVAPALDRLRRSMDLEYRATQQLATGQRTLDRAQQSCLITAVEQERMLGKLQTRYGTTASGASRLAAANDNLARTSSTSAVSAGALTTGIAGIASVAASAALALAAYGFAVVTLGTSAAKTGMEMQALARSFAAGAGSAVQGARELEFVRAESQRLGLAFAETAKQYGQLVAAARDTPLQGQATRDIFIAVSQAMTALGKSADDTGGALNAIQQMMSKGKVQAEELRGQLGERLPGAFGLAAAAMGKTTAELNKMLDDGEVLATDLLPKLAIELNKVYGAASAASANDLGANLNRLKNAWQEYQDAVASGGLNEALNKAARALTAFLRESDGAAQGRQLGDAINGIVTALERVPRGAENFGILAQMAREALSAFGGWIESFTALQGVAVETSGGIGESFSGVLAVVQAAINAVIGVAVAGYQMVGAAWNGLPAVFADISARAGNALIAGIESAINYLIEGLNKFVRAVNAVGSVLPSGFDFPKLTEFSKVAFGEIENTATGAASRIGASLSDIGKDATSKNYLGEFGESVSKAVDGQISRFRELRSAQDASNHLLREAGKIASEGKTADAYKNAAAAGKAAKEAADASGGAAKSAASSYDNLIQRTKDRIEELQLEAQYASKTATEVIKLKLAHDLERAAKKDGTAVTDAMRAEWDRLGDSLAAATQKMEAAKLAQQQLKDGLRETAEGLSSLFKDLAGGKGFDAAIKSFGSRSLESVIDGLLTGKGAIGVALGLAPTEKGGVGGLLNLDWSKMTKAVEKGTSSGTFSGFANIFGFGDPQQGPTQSGATLDQANQGSALSGIAGIGGAALGAYGAGQSSGQLMGALTGAISGATAGAVFGPPGMIIGAIIGAGAGILGGNSADKKAKEERKKQAEQAYVDAKPQFATFGSQLRGDPQNTLALQIEEARGATKKLTDVAFFASKIDEANKLYHDFEAYEARIRVDFARAYDGLATNLATGVGPDSPFAQSRDAVKALGTALKGFIDDTKTVFGEGAPQIQRSTEAARAYAIAVLDGAKPLSTVETRLQEIRGAAAGLQQVLVDLGMAADQAADAVSSGMTAALDRVKAAANDNLRSKITDSQGFGYVNELNALLKEVAGMRQDGIYDADLVDTYLTSEAQKIIDSSQVMGEAYARLNAGMPQLVGHIHEFTGALKGVAREADIAARRLNAQDRLFSATNDNSTLEGQLAAYNRQAMREREAEMKAGSEALVDLEAAQAAERYNIVKAWNDKIADDQKRAADEASAFWDRFSKQIREYTDGLRAGSESPLSPQARLAAAQSQYNAQLGLAQGGDRDALSGITSYSSDLLDAAKAYFASSTGYQDIFASVIAQLEALPDQVSETQLIINAIDAGAQATVDMLAVMKSSLEVAVNSGSAQQIAAALSTYFTQLDSNTSGSIDFSEMQAALGGMASNSQLYSMFTRLDTDASGNLEKGELIRAATATNSDRTKSVDDTLIGRIPTLALAEISSNTQGTANQVSQGNAQLNLINDATTRSRAQDEAYLSHLTSISAAGARIGANTLAQANRTYFNGASNPAQGAYADGGYTGPGGKYQEAGTVHKGEIVWSQSDISRFGGVGAVEALRTNDNFGMPAVAMPVMAGGGNNLVPALIARVEALTAEVKALRSDNNTGHARSASASATGAQHVREGVDVVASNTAAGARAVRRKAAA